MTIGIVGRKSGMTRVFTEDGNSVPVTVIEVEPNRVTLVKDADSDGYRAVQVTAGSRRSNRISKSEAGHFAKAGVEAGRGLWVAGKSKGKGFQGVVKRWNFRTQDATHGNSLSHRAPGSIGQCQTPGRVFKGKKMAGQMGSESVTTQGLEVVKVDVERSLLLIKGAVPGAPGGDVVVRPAIKA